MLLHRRPPAYHQALAHEVRNEETRADLAGVGRLAVADHSTCAPRTGW